MDIPEYDFITHTRTDSVRKICPTEVILIEGIMLFADSRIRNTLDLKIFINLDSDIRFIRRLRRDVLDRGRTVEAIIDQYLAKVRPMHKKYVEPSQFYANCIIDGGCKETAAAQIIECIKTLNEK